MLFQRSFKLLFYFGPDHEYVERNSMSKADLFPPQRRKCPKALHIHHGMSSFVVQSEEASHIPPTSALCSSLHASRK